VADPLGKFWWRFTDSNRGPVVDGEVCVMDEIGRSNFDRLQARAVRRCYYPECDPVTYAMFDLLVDRGKNIMGCR
jgi:bifunctional non-homologous end joining protein LigD